MTGTGGSAVPGRVSVVIVSWNSAAFLGECLASVAGQTRPVHQVVVVDNASRDGSAALARQAGAELVQNDDNLGFCRGSNLGWARSTGDAALFLNPDVILEENYLEHALEALHQPGVGMVAGKLLRFDGITLDSAGQEMARSRRTVERGYDLPDHGQFDEPGPVFSVCGAAALYRRETLEDVAPEGEVFDEGFFAFHEDLDLGWRAQRLGWQGWYEPAARARHFRGSTDAERRAGSRRRRLATLPAEAAYHAVKNRYLAMIKNDAVGDVLADLPFILGREMLLWGYLLLRRPTVGWRVLRDRAGRRRAWECRRRLAGRRQAGAAGRGEVVP
jgi:GT2 family glycosyltransferase